jgi:hypothetical protein
MAVAHLALEEALVAQPTAVTAVPTKELLEVVATVQLLVAPPNLLPPKAVAVPEDAEPG